MLKGQRRERARHKKQYGHRVENLSIFTTPGTSDRAARQRRKARRPSKAKR